MGDAMRRPNQRSAFGAMAFHGDHGSRAWKSIPVFLLISAIKNNTMSKPSSVRTVVIALVLLCSLSKWLISSLFSMAIGV